MLEHTAVGPFLRRGGEGVVPGERRSSVLGADGVVRGEVRVDVALGGRPAAAAAAILWLRSYP